MGVGVAANWRAWLLGAMLASGLADAALAQIVPDAGSVLRETERDRSLPLPPAAPAPIAVPEADLGASGTRVQVKRFTFSGNRRLSDAELAAAVASYLDRPLRLADLQAAAAAVAARYRADGWLVRAVLPRQEIADGVVEIRVVEATFGQLKREAPSPAAPAASTATPAQTRVDPDVVEATVLARQRSGEPVSLPALERGLLLANDLPGTEVSGSLLSGPGDGATDLLLVTAARPALAGEVAADDQGARSTGSERLNLRVGWASPLGLGDEANLQAQATPGIRYGRVAASLPIGPDGLRVGAGVSALSYRVRSDDFSAIQPRGSAKGASLDLSYPLIRAHDRNLYLTAVTDHKRFDNRTIVATTSHYGVDSAGLRLYGNVYDSLWNGGATDASLALTHGRVNLAGSPNQDSDALTAATAGDYTVVRYSLGRRQALDEHFTLSARIAGQVASKNLDSSERFSLGGPDGVRAYPVNEGNGAEGQLVNLDLRWRPPVDCRCSIAAFYDLGRVTVNRNADFAGATAPNRYTLRGYGIGVSAALPAGLRLEAQLAMRQGGNPGALPSGQDQDGSLHKTRAWLSISRSF